MSWRNAAELQSETTVPYIVRTSVARRIQLGAVRLLQTKIAEGSDGIMAKLQYSYIQFIRECLGWTNELLEVREDAPPGFVLRFA